MREAVREDALRDLADYSGERHAAVQAEIEKHQYFTPYLRIFARMRQGDPDAHAFMDALARCAVLDSETAIWADNARALYALWCTNRLPASYTKEALKVLLFAR